MKLEFVVPKESEEKMLKEFILECGVSRALARKIKLYGEMYINDTLAKNFYLVKPLDKIILIYNETLNEKIVTVNYDLKILYEDENLMVVFKDANIASQPSHRHQDDNLISYIKSYYLQKQITSNIHIVNRLDFSTSGILIVAKNGYIHHELTKNKNIVRKYLAVIEGHLPKKEDTVTVYIERENEYSIKRIVSPNGKISITHYKVLDEFETESLIELTLGTGRTHQIRVTMSNMGYPLVGDKLYGNGGDNLMLHCYYIKFYHPVENKEIEIQYLPEKTNCYWGKYIEKVLKI